MKTAYFNRFLLELPDEAVYDCAHQGSCDEDVDFWASRVDRQNITNEDLAAELKEYGAWDSKELQDDEANWKRIIWIAAGDIKGQGYKPSDDTIEYHESFA
jgi:maleate cis-trans isomerase